MSRYLNNILLALVWAALTGSFTLANFAFGLLLGWLALYLVREQIGRGADATAEAGYCRLPLLFINELILSGWRVARLVTSPKDGSASRAYLPIR